MSVLDVLRANDAIEARDAEWDGGDPLARWQSREAVDAAFADRRTLLAEVRRLREALYNCGLAAHFGGEMMASKRRGGREKLGYIEREASGALVAGPRS